MSIKMASSAYGVSASCYYFNSHQRLPINRQKPFLGSLPFRVERYSSKKSVDTP